MFYPNSRKVIVPVVCSRIEKWYKLTGIGVFGIDACMLELVAGTASQPEVVPFTGATCCKRNDMIDSQWGAGQRFIAQAIPTAMIGILNNLASQFGGEVRSSH